MKGARLLLALALVSGLAHGDEASPWVRCDQEGRCAVGDLPPVVSREDVQGYLTNGLTSSLAVTLSGRSAEGSRVAASARIDVRFEPWDEAFYVVLLEPSRQPQRLTLLSLEQLRSWWVSLELRLGMAEPVARKARLEITLVPFSEQEEADARQWYRDAVREGDGGPLTGVLDVFTVTSIKRRDVLHYAWSVRVRR